MRLSVAAATQSCFPSKTTLHLFASFSLPPWRWPPVSRKSLCLSCLVSLSLSLDAASNSAHSPAFIRQCFAERDELSLPLVCPSGCLLLAHRLFLCAEGAHSSGRHGGWKAGHLQKRRRIHPIDAAPGQANRRMTTAQNPRHDDCGAERGGRHAASEPADWGGNSPLKRWCGRSTIVIGHGPRKFCAC